MNTESFIKQVLRTLFTAFIADRRAKIVLIVGFIYFFPHISSGIACSIFQRIPQVVEFVSTIKNLVIELIFVILINCSSLILFFNKFALIIIGVTSFLVKIFAEVLFSVVLDFFKFIKFLESSNLSDGMILFLPFVTLLTFSLVLIRLAPEGLFRIMFNGITNVMAFH